MAGDDRLDISAAMDSSGLTAGAAKAKSSLDDLTVTVNGVKMSLAGFSPAAQEAIAKAQGIGAAADSASGSMTNMATASNAAAQGQAQLASSIDSASAAIARQNAELARNLEYALGPAPGRQIKSASQSGSVFATDLGVAAAGDAAARDAAMALTKAEGEKAAALASAALAGETAAQRMIGYESGTRRAADAAAVFSKSLGILSRDEVSQTLARQKTATEGFAQALIGVKTAGDISGDAAVAFGGKVVRSVGSAATAHEGLKVATAGTTREMIVLGHEALTGNFSRMPGSVMVLMERMGSLHTITSMISPTMIGAAAGVGVLALAFGRLAMDAIHAKEAVEGTFNAALIQGRDAAQVAQNVTAMAAAMRNSGTLGVSDSNNLAASIQTIPGISAKARESLAQVAEAFGKDQTGGDYKKAGDVLEGIFRSTGSMKAFVDENELLTGTEKERFDQLVQGQDKYRASEMAAHALQLRLAGYTKTLRDANEEYLKSGHAGVVPFVPELYMPPHLKIPEGANPGPSPDQRDRDRILEQGRTRQLDQLKRDRDELQRQMNTPGLIDADQIERTKQRIAELGEEIRQLSQPKGDANFLQELETRVAQQNAAIAERMAGAGQALGRGAAAGLDQHFSAAIDRVIAKARAAGVEISRGSGFRTLEEQAELHRKDPVGAAASGGSSHNRGLAMDLHGANGKLSEDELNRIKPFLAEEGLSAPLEHWNKKPEPWHIEPVGRPGQAGGRQGMPDTTQAIRQAQLQNEVQQYEAALADKTNADRLSGAQREQIERKLAQAKTQLADLSAREGDRAARDGNRLAMDTARVAVSEAAAGSQARIAAAQHEADVARSIYGAMSAEYVNAQHAVTMAQKEAAASRVRDTIEEKQEVISSSRQQLAAIKQDLAADVAEHTKTALQAAKAYEAAAAEIIASRRRLAAEMLSIDGLSDAESRALKKQLEAVSAEGDREIASAHRGTVQAMKAENDKYAADFKSAFDRIGSSIESSLGQLVSGQTTYAKAVQSVWQSTTVAVTSMLGSIASKGAAAVLSGGTAGGKGLGDYLGDKVGNWASDKIGNMVGNAVPALATGGAQAAETATPIVAAITASTTAIVGAIGTLEAIDTAVAVKPSVLGTTYAGGGIIPAAAGGWSVPSSFGTDTVPAMLTPGEMVLPRHISDWVQQAAANGGGGGDVHVHLGGNMMLDGAGFTKWFNNNGGRQMIADGVRSGFRSNALTPRSL